VEETWVGVWELRKSLQFALGEVRVIDSGRFDVVVGAGFRFSWQETCEESDEVDLALTTPFWKSLRYQIYNKYLSCSMSKLEPTIAKVHHNARTNTRY